MENALYYTLSTISQTLAGALAVMVAFVLLKLPAIDDAITEARSRLRQFEHVAPLRETWAILIAQGVDALATSEQGKRIGQYFGEPNRRSLGEGRLAWKRRPWITRFLCKELVNAGEAAMKHSQHRLSKETQIEELEILKRVETPGKCWTSYGDVIRVLHWTTIVAFLAGAAYALHLAGVRLCFVTLGA